MVVHTMSVPEMVLEARKDFQALRNKTTEPARRLRKEFLRSDRENELGHLVEWSSPKGKNKWLIFLVHGPKGLRTYTMVHFKDIKGRVAALWVTTNGPGYYIGPHVIQRYGERFDPTANPVERLRSFFMENHWYAVEPEREMRPGVWEAHFGLNHGLGLGDWHVEEGYFHIRTFVDFGNLFPNQLEQMERLDFDRHWTTLTKGQRQDLLRRAQLDEDQLRELAA